MKTTPILVVDAVEPSRDFFRDRLGFAVVVEVPHGDVVGFSLLVRGEHEIMLQSAASVAADLTQVRDERFHAIVYCDVPDAAAMAEHLAGIEVVVPLRTTFYGALELFVREPGGNIVGLSSPAPAA